MPVLTGSHFVGSRESRAGADAFRAEDPATGQAPEPAFAEATPAEVPDELRGENARAIWRLVEGRLAKDPL